MIVLVGGEKGGVGKTTLAVNLAAMRARAGHDVLLVDADKQASANLWASIRDQEKVDPPVRCVQKRGKGLAADVRDLATRYEDIVASIMASATPFCFCTTQKHLSVKIVIISMA